MSESPKEKITEETTKNKNENKKIINILIK